MSKKVIKTTTAQVWLDEDGIIRAVFNDGVRDSLETARENIEAGLQVSGGKKRPMLLDMSRLRAMNKAARDCYAQGDKREGAELAVGLVVKSPLSRAIGNFFIGLNPSTTPTRLFTDPAKALEWLKELLD